MEISFSDVHLNGEFLLKTDNVFLKFDSLKEMFVAEKKAALFSTCFYFYNKIIFLLKHIFCLHE